LLPTEKINTVRKERTQVMSFSEKKSRSKSPTTTHTDAAGAGAAPKQLTPEEIRLAEERKAAALIEIEEKRMEALRRRQQDELNRIIERERTLAETQAKIARAEEEERKKKKLHDKKVAEEKAEEEKRRQAREEELKRIEREEAARRRALGRREAEVAEKLKKQQLIKEREIAKHAREMDEERKRKVEEARQKTEALLKAQEDVAEQNRLKMLERERRIVQQLEEKKERKRLELEEQREKSTKRIMEAIHKRIEEHERVEQEYDARQTQAAQRAKEKHKEELDALKKQAAQRTERNRLRFQRLVDAYQHRMDHRQEIIDKRNERDQVYGRIKAERDQEIAMMKFMTELKLQDKLENVERVARMNEFRRLQILQKIYTEDNKYEDIKQQRQAMLARHNDEAKNALARKHEIADTMERMRMSNDFTLLDKLFAQRNKKEKRVGTAKNDDDDGPATAAGGGGAAAGGGGGGGGHHDAPKLHQTI
jgi:hypothetical protein